MDIDQIKASNPMWFSPGAMRFFNTQVDDRVYEGPGGIYFVTSEEYDTHSPRRYTVRIVTLSGISSEAFMGHGYRSNAHARAQWLATGAPSPE